MAQADPPDLKQSILEMSAQLGSELGEDGLTMRGIATRLGVSATSLYQHFEGKASILRAVRFWGLERLNAQLAPAFELDDPLEQLVEQGCRYVAFARENPWLYRVLMESEEEHAWASLSQTERGVAMQSHGLVVRALRKGIERGMFRADLDLELTPLLMWASLHGLAALIIRGRPARGHPAFPSDREAIIGWYVRTLTGVLLP